MKRSNRAQAYPLLSKTALDEIAAALAEDPWPGYPRQSDRFFHSQPHQMMRNGVLHVPNDGVWHIMGHANRQGVPPHLLDAEVPQEQAMSPHHVTHWRREGLLTDQHGRPIHPHWEQLLADKRIGLPTGLGMFYRYGPNVMVDSIIYRHENNGARSFLLIRQQMTNQWGFPGGFVDPDDTSLESAARRETAEEAGLSHIGGTAQTIVRSLPLRRRDTLHAWSEVVVLLFHASQEYLHGTIPKAGDDALDVGWFTESQMAALPMQETHLPYLRKALDILDNTAAP